MTSSGGGGLLVVSSNPPLSVTSDCFATPTTSTGCLVKGAEISPAGHYQMSSNGSSKDMHVTTKILQDYFNMMRVQIISDTNTSPTFSLETPNPKMMYPPIDLPTTAELMQRCLSINPFEAKFREANEKISNGVAVPPTTAANQSYEAMEANGLVPIAGTSGCLPTSASMTDLLLKIPQTTHQQSPGIFSNISILSAAAAHDNFETTRENLKTADISKLLSVVNNGDTSAQAPRTADVLNAVLDMHSDRLATINYLNKPDFSAFLRSPSSSAPNSASILGVAIPSTSYGNGAPSAATAANLLKSTYSPNQHDLSVAAAVAAYSTPIQKSPAGSVVAQPNVAQPPQLGGIGNSGQWGEMMKPVKKEDFYGDDQSNLTMMHMDRTEHQSTSGDSEREVTPLTTPGSSNPVGRPPNGTPGRGRGRGRSTTADMQPDERRNTILERNKAAAVRYRKRKKEEHDDMIGRVHGMEQEKNTLLTQNQVLRRELERVSALLQEREQRCVCLKGMPLSTDGSDALRNGMYNNSSSDMHMSSMKRPKM